MITPGKFRGSPMRRPHGLTLVEVLMVVAIISILAALLLPMLARAREQARRIACLHNMKQCAVAMIIYVNDFGSVFPRGGLETGGSSAGVFGVNGWNTDYKHFYESYLGGRKRADYASEDDWRDALKNTRNGFPQVLNCPSFKKNSHDRLEVAWYFGGATDFRLTLSKAQRFPQNVRPVLDSQPPFSSVLLFADAGERYWQPDATGKENHVERGRVAGKNASALDASARWVPGEYTYWKGETNYGNPSDMQRLYPYHSANIRLNTTGADVGKLYGDCVRVGGIGVSISRF